MSSIPPAGPNLTQHQDRLAEGHRVKLWGYNPYSQVLLGQPKCWA